jgi:G3E family GTPase
VFCTSQGDLNPALIFDADDIAGLGLQGMKTAAGSTRAEPAARHVAHAEAGLWSRSLRLSRPLDREKFIQAVESLPQSVFRAKGLVDFTGSDETMLFQYVCGRFELSVFPKRGVRERFVTFIGCGGAGIPDVLETLPGASSAFREALRS